MGLADIGDRMLLAHGNRQGDLVHACIERCLGTSQVGHQRSDVEVRQGQRMSHDKRTVGHLRQQLGGDERAHLDLAQACLRQGRYPLQLELGGHDGLDALQAVTRPHFTYQDVDVSSVFHSRFSSSAGEPVEHSRNAAAREKHLLLCCSIRQNYVLFLVLVVKIHPVNDPFDELFYRPRAERWRGCAPWTADDWVRPKHRLPQASRLTG
ncbi:hypothetical protein EMIT0P201_10536 [Pseudomonas chlororaphis]